jgi:FkbM family methyltransferase
MKAIIRSHPLDWLLPAGLRGWLREMALRTIPSMRHLDMGRRLSRLKKLGFMPESIVDVGAAQGHWAAMAARLWPRAAILGIEPNEGNIPFLEETKKQLPHFDYLRGLLGREDKQVQYVDASDQTSLFDVAAPGEKLGSAHMYTLDSLLQRLPRPPQFIKLDVQGYELEVLSGGTEAMRTCDALLLEVSFISFFEGVPTVDQVVAFMRERGFHWYDVMGIYRRPYDDALAQLDVMFLRSDHPLRSMQAI